MTPCNNILSIMYIEKSLLKKKPRTSYDKSQVFKDIQVGQFPWEKFIIWDDGLNMHDVCYKVWSYIGGKDKLFNPKTTHFINMSVVKMQRLIFLEWHTKYFYNKDSLPKRENLHWKKCIIFVKVL
jgi:hypothetical protein